MFSSKMYVKQKILSINSIDGTYLLSTISSTCTCLFVYYPNFGYRNNTDIMLKFNHFFSTQKIPSFSNNSPSIYPLLVIIGKK